MLSLEIDCHPTSIPGARAICPSGPSARYPGSVKISQMLGGKITQKSLVINFWRKKTLRLASTRTCQMSVSNKWSTHHVEVFGKQLKCLFGRRDNDREKKKTNNQKNQKLQYQCQVQLKPHHNNNNNNNNNNKRKVVRCSASTDSEPLGASTT